MFGSDDQNQNPDAQTTVSTAAPLSAPSINMPTQDISAQPEAVTSAPSAPTIPDPMVTPSAQVDQSADLPTDLPAEASAEAGASAYVEAGVNGVPLQSAYSEPPQVGPAKPSQPENMPTVAPAAAAAPDLSALDPDLAQIKQQALQSLGPLVGQLDQAPDEKFKTVMMLIQASDNSKMLKDAYQAASQITDEKTRAQALLDIINEVNYFTQQNQKTGL